MDHYRKRCVEPTLHGRCPQQVSRSKGTNNDDYCYWHDKVNRGLSDHYEAIVLDDEESI